MLNFPLHKIGIKLRVIQQSLLNLLILLKNYLRGHNPFKPIFFKNGPMKVVLPM